MRETSTSKDARRPQPSKPADFWAKVQHCYDQGLNRKDAAKSIGYSYTRFLELLKYNPIKHNYGMNSVVVRTEARWNISFQQLINDFASQGLNRKQTAKAIGVHEQTFLKLLEDMDDPFPKINVIADYQKRTGKFFRDSIQKMIARGYSISEAAEEIGYSHPKALRKALERRGIVAEFVNKRGKHMRECK